MRLLHPIRVRRWYDDDVVITSPGHSGSSNLRIHGDQTYIQIFRKLTVWIRQRTYSRLVDSILVRLSSGVNKRRGRVPVSTPVAGIWSVGSIQGTRLRSVPDIDYRIRDSLVTDNLSDSAVPFCRSSWTVQSTRTVVVVIVEDRLLVVAISSAIRTRTTDLRWHRLLTVTVFKSVLPFLFIRSHCQI